ncbi:MAG TPA: hypothetical protein VID51_02050 [Solirubrobacterales bacterium]|jgi:hypothetical protein
MLIDKENLFPAPFTKRRSKRLITKDEDVQVQATVLHVEGPDGNEDRLLQMKFWTQGMESWSMVIYDRLHNIVAATGPCRHEKQCWKAVTGILKRKGYWGGDLEG